ncbi:uncharacterized protein LOC141721841 [Apium graveolens]|uniref:uncharacterized protein LOC141721841 n=1 Tax=Apium graveolens TaxID=4045 RepID=UPI003D7BAE29
MNTKFMDESSNTHTQNDEQTNSLHNSQDNPYYLQTSDSPGMKLVSDPFDGTGIAKWKRSISIALSARNKLGFLDGSITKPLITSTLFKSWSRCNDMVISWILGALSKSIGRSVIYSTTVHEMWSELEERYGVSNGAQLFSLHKEIAEITQGNCNMAEYFTKLKMLWDDVDSLCLIPACSCGCTYGASQKLSKFQQDQRMVQFLMGLNDSFTAMRGSILMKSPLPSIGQVYSLLLQEETQIEIHVTNHFKVDSVSLAVNSNRPGQYATYNKKITDGKKVHCNCCKKSGHIIDKCYKLHGFLPYFKFNKPFTGQRRMAAQVEISDSPQVGTANSGTNTGTSNTHTGNTTMTHNMSSDIYTQLVNLLKSHQNSDSNVRTANFAGPFSEEATGTW